MKTLIRKDICTPLFVAELFIIAKIWKQSKCLSSVEWIRRCDIYTYTYIKQNITQS